MRCLVGRINELKCLKIVGENLFSIVLKHRFHIVFVQLGNLFKRSQAIVQVLIKFDAIKHTGLQHVMNQVDEKLVLIDRGVTHFVVFQKLYASIGECRADLICQETLQS